MSGFATCDATLLASGHGHLGAHLFVAYRDCVHQQQVGGLTLPRGEHQRQAHLEWLPHQVVLVLGTGLICAVKPFSLDIY